MTIDAFWKKYNHCPLCQSYATQASLCEGCKWELPIFEHRADKLDKFYPTWAAIELINREVTE